MGKRETEQFTKKVYTASNNPSSLLHRTLVQKKNPSKEDAPYCKKLCEILQELKKISATKDPIKTTSWIDNTISSLESFISDTGIEHRGAALTDILNTIKGK